ncbi:hypothetical protein WD347_004619 [Vibrio parahaemolyticus]|uniref:hypothetical protein n=1 Tax=Vibrio parahaemolyticus TaxID=670 RepID=UPI0005C783A3|nr:hypothetical protein [Vibrio parahaemolyticus]EJG0923820.1 hypothetical protein [Vibrio parahaemolyticus O1:K68]EJG0933486.1 hypothetical protein [Vibrio parahaemolyticus O1]EJG0947673.1 hypothetical protein [Vibrio parahaemolyticus O10]EGQ9064932.1 hypothetical protein [Vibrio parahaemolyticus]EGQ9104821.1 hypothetical protein [Vibrio parahaemolyticus]
MDIVSIIILVLCATLVFPVLFGLFELKASKLKAIIEIEGNQITIRKLAVERILRLKGSQICTTNIVRIQLVKDPLGGTSVTLFNKYDGALDFWVPEHLMKGVKSELVSACPYAKFVEI